MKLYLNNGNILNVNDNAILEITNLEEFLEILNKNSSKVPSPHFSLDLNYKLIVNGQEYMGTTTCDSYHGFTVK